LQHAPPPELGDQPPTLPAGGGRAAPAAGEQATLPFVRGERKIGRNEPCPCGSGRKFKHCHGVLERAGS
jgi:preprotein translocase subunit SecA